MQTIQAMKTCIFFRALIASQTKIISQQALKLLRFSINFFQKTDGKKLIQGVKIWKGSSFFYRPSFKIEQIESL